MPFLLLMPSYNQAHYIAQAVNSVLAQDDGDWELWILDNSTDGTPELMRRFQDPRIRFHHIAQRMDPGSCLNWMLERAQGEMFSYVHTDNNLRADYVRSMRRALDGRPLGLAYCDMRLITADGSIEGLVRREMYDLARLFSFDSLGAPFAATVALAKTVGGFKPNDLADDVRFCIAAWGHAEYVYVRQPLLDYRVHAQSRLEVAGMTKLRESFLDMFVHFRPSFVARGLDPVPALRHAVVQRFEDLEWFVEDLWYRRLGHALDPWWSEGSPLEHLFHAGLLRLPGFEADAGPRRRALVRDDKGRIALWPWQVAAAAAYLTLRRRQLQRLVDRIEQVLLPWAVLTSANRPERIVVSSPGFRSLVCARLLERGLNWRPVVHPGVVVPAWTGWTTGSGAAPQFEFAELPTLSA